MECIANCSILHLQQVAVHDYQNTRLIFNTKQSSPTSASTTMCAALYEINIPQKVWFSAVSLASFFL